MAVPTARTWLGIAKEVTKGTAVTPSAFIPINTLNPHDTVEYLSVQPMQGSMAKDYGLVPGFQWCEIEIGGLCYPDTFGWVAAGILGDITTTGAGAPFTHAMSVNNGSGNQPTAHTLTDFYGVTQVRQYAGVQWHELSVKFTSNGLLEWSAKGTGLKLSSTLAAPSYSFSTVAPLQAWTNVVTIGGVAVGKGVSGEVSIKRAMEVIKGMNGTQVPSAVFLGPAEVAAKLSVFIDDDTELTRYTTNTQPALDLNFSTGAGAAAVQVKLHMSTCAYKDTKPNRGKIYVAYDIDAIGIANTTDAGASGGVSPIKVTLQNAIASGTYI